MLLRGRLTTSSQWLLLNSYFKFIFGALLLFIALFPVYWLIVMAVQPSEALSDPKLLPHSLTVMNFIELFTEKNFGRALSNSLLITLKFSVFSVLFEVLLGFVMALFVQSLTKKTARLMRISLLIPYLLPSVTVALSFRMMLSPNYGIINKALEGLGITAPNWFSDMRTALPMLILIDIWQNAPFVFLLLYAAMQAIPKSQYEAAKIDGASYPALVRYVTIPGILPVLALSALLRTIDSFRIFDKVNLLTGGGPANSTTTITQYLYTYGIKNLKFGFGSAGAIIMTILVLLLSVAYIKKAVE